MATSKNRARNRRRTATVIAIVLVLSTLFAGTLAWQSISQKALNENKGDINPGGRLHDDYDGENKDVYVENFGKNPIFARIRLDEYMELGAGAGLKETAPSTPDPDNKSVPLVPGTDLNDMTTWVPHVPKGLLVAECVEGFHDYFEWTMGGEKWYMPTFNKYSEGPKALDPDQPNPTNITEEDLTALPPIVIPDGSTHDFWDDDQYKLAADSTLGVDGAGISDDELTWDKDAGAEVQTPATHHAKETVKGGTVISMSAWKALGSPKGAYWVYDVDGWAYWAQAIQPGTATGLLLDSIALILAPDEEYYYGINVVAQFASSGDWGDQADNAGAGSGFYTTAEGTPPTADGLFVLNQAANRLSSVTITPDSGSVGTGNTLDLTAVVKILGRTISNQNVTWSIVSTGHDASTSVIAGPSDTGTTLSISATEPKLSITVRATSVADTSVFKDVVLTIM